MKYLVVCALLAASVGASSASPAAPEATSLVVKSEFLPGLGTLVGLGFDATRNRVWAYGAFAAQMQSFTNKGVAKEALLRPGEAADDADIEFAPKAFKLAGTPVPAGSLLFINGETGVAEIYAVDPLTGATLATLTTGFGASHVVGGAHHTQRKSFFLVQDKVPGGSAASLVAEIHPTTGAVLNSFQIGASFTVNYGDLDISKTTGNLFVVSSDEPRIAEFTPTGTLVQYLALPAGVSSLSGIAIDDKRSEIWVSGTGGKVWRLGVVVTPAADIAPE